MWGIIWRILAGAGSAALPFLLPYLGILRRYLWVVTLVVGAGGGWYLTSNWYKLDNQAKLGAALAAKNTQIGVLLKRTEKLAAANAALTQKSDSVRRKYEKYLNDDVACNAKLGAVRLFNSWLQPMYRPEDLSPDDAARTSIVTGKDIARALETCSLEYNKVRNEIIRLHKEADKQH